MGKKGEHEQWNQIRERDAIIFIDNIRKGLDYKDQRLVARNVVNYLYMLTGNQRKELGKDLLKALNSNDFQDKSDRALIKAVAGGVVTHLKKVDDLAALAEKVQPDRDYEQHLKDQLGVRQTNASTLYQATKDYVELRDGKYFFKKRCNFY